MIVVTLIIPLFSMPPLYTLSQKTIPSKTDEYNQILFFLSMNTLLASGEPLSDRVHLFYHLTQRHIAESVHLVQFECYLKHLGARHNDIPLIL